MIIFCTCTGSSKIAHMPPIHCKAVPISSLPFLSGRLICGQRPASSLVIRYRDAFSRERPRLQICLYSSLVYWFLHDLAIIFILYFLVLKYLSHIHSVINRFSLCFLLKSLYCRIVTECFQ